MHAYVRTERSVDDPSHERLVVHIDAGTHVEDELLVLERLEEFSLAVGRVMNRMNGDGVKKFFGVLLNVADEWKMPLGTLPSGTQEKQQEWGQTAEGIVGV